MDIQDAHRNLHNGIEVSLGDESVSEKVSKVDVNTLEDNS